MQRSSTHAIVQLPKYGSTLDGGQLVLEASGLKAQRKTLNVLGVVFSLFAPWSIFAVVYWALSFSMHYQRPYLCWFIVEICGMLVGVSGTMAWLAYKRRQNGDPRIPTWYIFVFVSMLLYWLCGVMLGCINFADNMSPYYDMSNLNAYPGVDPNYARGQQLMDAGRIVFTRQSSLNLSMASSFSSGDTYCVAPVTSITGPLVSYDFWAAGVNCCRNDHFDCGEAHNPRARAGLRVLSEDRFFKLAVERAKFDHNIRSMHPLFFHWVEDPLADAGEKQEQGLKHYIFGVLCAFAIQLFMVSIASISFFQCLPEAVICVPATA